MAADANTDLMNREKLADNNNNDDEIGLDEISSFRRLTPQVL